MAFYKVCGNYYGTDNDANSLKHYRTPGSKNGVRKYQYEDGTLTPAGKIHYGIGNGGGAARGYTDTGTGQGPTGLGRLAYKVGGTQGYADYRKAASNVNKAAGNVSRWADRAGKDVNEAVGNVTRWGSNVPKNIMKALSTDDELERFVNARNNLWETAGPLHEGVVGYDERKAKQDRLNEVANRYNTAPYGANSTDRREWDARRMETGAELQRLQNEARVNSVNDQRNAALARKEYDEALKDYNNQIPTKIVDGVQKARDLADQAAKDVSNAASNAKDWVGNRFSEAKELGSKAVSDAKNWTDKNVTGGSAKNDYDLNMARATVASRNSDYNMSKEKPNMNSKAAQRSEDTERTYRNNAAEAKRTYENSLVGRAEKAGKDIGKATSDVKTWGEQAAKDAGDWVGERAKDVGDAVGTAAKNVGNAVGKAAKDVGEWGKGAVEKGRDFITGLFGKKKKG